MGLRLADVRRAAEKHRREMAQAGFELETVRSKNGVPEIVYRKREGEGGEMVRGAAEQMRFEGIGISGLRFGMKSVTSLEAKEELHIGEPVGGEWSGSVVGVRFEKDKDGVLVRHHVVAVSKATIGVG